ncbi:MAG: type I-C CRISPR-associated protein Cas8c/Csd1 [Hydrogenimonas sp.]|nr:MAG: type I-C CRISPR-associated protein Cas8c/Csd1 [Hydrogenimonas sp.]
MILRRLYEYYRYIESKEEVPKIGFQRKEIPFVVVIDERGQFHHIWDTRSKEGRRLVGKLFLVPSEVHRSGQNAWKKANLLWDHPGYLFGIHPTKPEMGKKQHLSFLQRIREVFGEVPKDEGVLAILHFLESRNFETMQTDPHWSEIVNHHPFMSFQLLGDDGLVCEREGVKSIISQMAMVDDAPLQTCLVTGQKRGVVRLHPKIKRVPGAQNSGAPFVSFNLPSFNSYGKKQGENAPIGKTTAFAYATALNRLLRDPGHHIYLGEMTMVYWSREPHPIEKIFHTCFMQSQPTDQEKEALQTLLKASYDKDRKDLDIPLYVLGLSPNAGRLSIRCWYEGTIRQTLHHIQQYFDELKLLKRSNESSEIPMGRLLLSTANDHTWDNVPPNLTGTLLSAILNGTNYPETLLLALIRRIRSGVARKYTKRNIFMPHITYERIALLKAIFIRNYKKRVALSLDRSCYDVEYLLGRLFATFEHLHTITQSLSTTIVRDRYYRTASTTPQAIFPFLTKIAYQQLQDAKTSVRHQYSQLIEEIMSRLDELPKSLPLKKQGIFAIGYYHQRQTFFSQTDLSNEEKL